MVSRENTVVGNLGCLSRVGIGQHALRVDEVARIGMPGRVSPFVMVVEKLRVLQIINEQPGSHAGEFAAKVSPCRRGNLEDDPTQIRTEEGKEEGEWFFSDLRNVS